MDGRKAQEPITIAQAGDESYRAEWGEEKNRREVCGFQSHLACRLDNTSLTIFIWLKNKTPIAHSFVRLKNRVTYTCFSSCYSFIQENFVVCHYVIFRIIPTSFLCMSTLNLGDTKTGNDRLVLAIIELLQCHHYGSP